MQRNGIVQCDWPHVQSADRAAFLVKPPDQFHRQLVPRTVNSAAFSSASESAWLTELADFLSLMKLREEHAERNQR